MTFNLENFVNKEVIITLNRGEVIETIIRKWDNSDYPYRLSYKDREGYVDVRTYTKDGIYDRGDFNGSNDIKSIRLKKPMTIDLEQFVGNECIITLRNGNKCQVHITDVNSCYVAYGEYLDDKFSYYCQYSKNGVKYGPKTTVSEFDIIHIKEIPKETSTKPMNSPELPETTIEKLAEVLSPDAVKYITGTEEYVTFMTKMLTEFVRERMGNLIEDVECEIVSTMVSDKIDLRVVK